MLPLVRSCVGASRTSRLMTGVPSMFSRGTKAPVAAVVGVVAIGLPWRRTKPRHYQVPATTWFYEHFRGLAAGNGHIGRGGGGKLSRYEVGSAEVEGVGLLDRPAVEDELWFTKWIWSPARRWRA